MRKFFEINLDNYHKLLISYTVKNDEYHYSVSSGTGEEVDDWTYEFGSYTPQRGEPCPYANEEEFVAGITMEMERLFHCNYFIFKMPASYLIKTRENHKPVLIVQADSEFDARKIAAAKLGTAHSKVDAFDLEEALMFSDNGLLPLS